MIMYVKFGPHVMFTLRETCRDCHVCSNWVAILRHANEGLRGFENAGPPSSVQELLVMTFYVKFGTPAICTFCARAKTISDNVNYVNIGSPFSIMQIRSFGALKLLGPPSMS